MTTYGLTTAGFTPKPFNVIRPETEARLRSIFGKNFPLGDRSWAGQQVAIVTEAIASLWLLLEQIYAAGDPDSAMDAALEAISAYTGTYKHGATYSRLLLTLTGVPSSVIPDGYISEDIEQSVQFQTVGVTMIVAVPAWLPSTGYALLDRVTNAGNVYSCITAGVSAGSGGPTTEADDITDGTAHWIFVGEGTGASDNPSRATLTGPKVAIAGSITEIVSSAGGWLGVKNLRDAVIGQDQMTNEQLRSLREEEIGAPGTGTVPAIIAALREVIDVIAVNLFENKQDYTDDDGIPPHSLNPLVTGGADQDVFDSLFVNVGAGIRTYGDVVGTVSDAEGNEHEFAFDRPDEIPIYIAMTITVNPKKFPSDGVDQIKTQIVEWGQDPDGAGYAGRDVVADAVGANAFQIAGVLRTPTVNIGTAPGPVTNTDIAISTRQQAKYDSTRIAITVETGVP